MDSDRCVHAVLPDGREVVRYDRAGKWYIEGAKNCQRVNLRTAVRTATAAGTTVHLGLPGGTTFDVGVRRLGVNIKAGVVQ